MGLVRRARVEVYVPERSGKQGVLLSKAVEQEFLYTFGGCTVVKNTKGLYLGADGKTHVDKISVIYADTPFELDPHFEALSVYADQLREAALEMTHEESVLIAVHAVYHSV